MNTAKSNQLSGSESNNAILGTTNQDEINKFRSSFAGARYEKRIIDDKLGAVTFWHVKDDKCVYVMGFSGKRRKPDFNYRFRSMERAKEFEAKWYDALLNKLAAKSARRLEQAASRSQGHELSVGDVLSASWGYDQTNIDYYQVTKLIGNCMVEIQRIKSESVETGFLQGDCVPCKNSFVGEPMRKVVIDKKTVKVRSFGVWATKKESIQVDGVDIFSPDHYTAYA